MRESLFGSFAAANHKTLRETHYPVAGSSKCTHLNPAKGQAHPLRYLRLVASHLQFIEVRYTSVKIGNGRQT